MYKTFGENKEDLIVLDLIMKQTDTKEKILDAYDKNADIVPEFPIILYDDGAFALSEITGTPGQSRPTWIVHPTRELQKTTYFEPEMSQEVAEALEDGCGNTKLIQTPSVLSPLSHSPHLKSKELRLISNSDCLVKLELSTPNGRTLFSRSMKLNVGENKMLFDNLKLAQSFYFLRIFNNSGETYSYKVALE